MSEWRNHRGLLFAGLFGIIPALTAYRFGMPATALLWTSAILIMVADAWDKETRP